MRNGKVAIICVISSLFAVQCTLEYHDLGIDCEGVQSIQLSSGGVCLPDACTSCSKDDEQSCNSYKTEGAFTQNRCPHDFMCTTLASGNGANFCMHKTKEKACGVDLPYLCGDSKKCASSCSKCEDNEACYLIINIGNDKKTGSKDGGGDECNIGQRECSEAGNLRLCAGGVWETIECESGCEDGICLEESVSECEDGLRRCEGDNETQECQDGNWKTTGTCQYGCLEGECTEKSDPGESGDEEGDGGEGDGGDEKGDGGEGGDKEETGCGEGEVRCAEETVVEICQSKEWKKLSECGENQICSEGECVLREDVEEGKCENKLRRCQNDVAQECVDETWVSETKCMYGCEDGFCNEELIGKSCEESSYQQTCINGDIHALVCENGVIRKRRCADGSCSVNPSNPLEVICQEGCTADSKGECAPACNEDGTKGYYWNHTKSPVSFDCPNADCRVVDGFVSCGQESCNAKSENRCVPACSADKKTGYYMNGSNNIKTKTCSNGDCVSYKGNIYCGMPEACTRETYEPECTEDGSGTYCSADEIVKTWGCGGGEKCQLRFDGSCDLSSRCIDGKYNVSEYPKGFIDCVKDPESTVPETCNPENDKSMCEKGHVYVCGQNGRYYLKETCTENQRCDDGQCIYESVPESCEYGVSEAICAGESRNELYVCGSDNKYYKKAVCPDSQPCRVNSGWGQCIDESIPKACQKGDPAKCVGLDLYVCSKNGYYYLKETCSETNPCFESNGYGGCEGAVLPNGASLDCVYEGEGASPALCLGDDEKDLYVCGKSNRYYKKERCPEGTVCRVSNGFGQCIPPEVPESCKYGNSNAICAGNAIYECGKKNWYLKHQVCDENETCTVHSTGKTATCLQAGVPGECTNAAHAVCQGQDVYVCGNNGWYYLNKTCAEDAACSISATGYGDCRLFASDIKGTCERAVCSNVDHNAYFCDTETHTYYFDAAHGTCSAEKPCKVCGNGYAGCGITCKDEFPSDISGTCSVAKCSNVDHNAYFCDEKTHSYYFDAAHGTCSSEKPCKVCSNGYAGCGITCKGEFPSDIGGTCVIAKCSNVDKNAYFCNEETHTYYFDKTHGTCSSEKPCKVCSNGYAGCGITCKE